MPIDRWPTHTEQDHEELTEEAAYHPLRPRASMWIDPRVARTPQGLKEQRVIPNPRTPIPARASALPPNTQLKPRHSSSESSQKGDVSRMPTVPSTPSPWQYEEQGFVVESSVPSLSLARRKPVTIDKLDTMPPQLSPTIDELDTIPPQLSPTIDELDTMPPQLSPTIDELDTTPPQLSPTLDKQTTVPPQLSPAIDELSTLPPKQKAPAVRNDAALFEHYHNPNISAGASVIDGSLKVESADGTSWTTAQGKDSWLAQRVASKKKDEKKRRKSALSLSPVERLRWWLLYPGRIEFLLWLNGTIVLVAITFLLLFATIMSMGGLNAGSVANSSAHNVQRSHSVGGNPPLAQTPCSVASAKKPQCRSTTVSSSGLQLTLVDNSVLYAGTPIYVHGQGFSANGTVALTYDAQLPCRPNITQTDARGDFSLSLWLGAAVQAGKHQIQALDMASSHAVSVTVDIAATPTGRVVSSSNGQTGSGAATPITGAGQGVDPTPVKPTPAPSAPTVSTSPTVNPSPTVSVSPSPTIAATATIGATATPPITKKATDHYLALRSTLYNESSNGHFSINPWLWVAIVGYMLSMTLLGLAGLLYRRKRRQSL